MMMKAQYRLQYCNVNHLLWALELIEMYRIRRKCTLVIILFDVDVGIIVVADGKLKWRRRHF